MSDDNDTTATILAALANAKRPIIGACTFIVVANEFVRLVITTLGTRAFA